MVKPSDLVQLVVNIVDAMQYVISKAVQTTEVITLGETIAVYSRTNTCKFSKFLNTFCAELEASR